MKWGNAKDLAEEMSKGSRLQFLTLFFSWHLDILSYDAWSDEKKMEHLKEIYEEIAHFFQEEKEKLDADPILTENEQFEVDLQDFFFHRGDQTYPMKQEKIYRLREKEVRRCMERMAQLSFHGDVKKELYRLEEAIASLEFETERLHYRQGFRDGIRLLMTFLSPKMEGQEPLISLFMGLEEEEKERSVSVS